MDVKGGVIKDVLQHFIAFNPEQPTITAIFAQPLKPSGHATLEH